MTHRPPDGWGDNHLTQFLDACRGQSNSRVSQTRRLRLLISAQLMGCFERSWWMLLIQSRHGQSLFCLGRMPFICQRPARR